MRRIPGSAFTVIVRQVVAEPDVFLVWRGDLEHWELTGGGMEPGEIAAHAAVREVKEETGFGVTLLGHVATYNIIGEDRKSWYPSFLFVGSVPAPKRPSVKAHKPAYLPTT